MTERQESRLGIEYEAGTLPTLRGVGSKNELSRPRTYGLALEFAAENEEQFAEYVEANTEESE